MRVTHVEVAVADAAEASHASEFLPLLLIIILMILVNVLLVLMLSLSLPPVLPCRLLCAGLASLSESRCRQAS